MFCEQYIIIHRSHRRNNYVRVAVSYTVFSFHLETQEKLETVYKNLDLGLFLYLQIHYNINRDNRQTLTNESILKRQYKLLTVKSIEYLRGTFMGIVGGRVL